MSNPDPAHGLQSSARKFAKHVAPHRQPKKVTVSDEFGVIGTLAVGAEPEAIVIAVSAAKAGWDFTGPVPRFDGTLVQLHGRKAEILKLLVDARGPVPAKIIRDALDAHMSEGTARWHVGDLRDALAVLFPGLDEPISTTPEGYLLQIR